MFALSVSISTSSSPLETSSPSDFSHLRIVPSSIESDRRGIATSAMAAVLRGGQGEAEHGPPPVAVVDPDPPAVALDDPAADRQPDPRAPVSLPVVQALEHLEDVLARLGRDADAAVGDRDLRHALRDALVAHPYPGAAVGVELQCVRDEVLHQLLELAAVAQHARQLADLQFR